MNIQYALFPNTLTPDPDDYLAVVQPRGTADLDKVAERMIANGSVLAKADILALLESAITTTTGLLLEGNRVVLGGLVELSPAIQGVFDSATDSFDPTRHRVVVGGGPGSRVRTEVAKNSTVDKVEGLKPKPNLVSYQDFTTATENDVITPGSIGTLIGHRLKVNPALMDEGLFIVNATTGADVQRIGTFQKNKPGELVWLNPAPGDLPAGTDRLEVRTRLGTAELRKGTLNPILTRP